MMINDDWIKKIKEFMTPQKYTIFDEIEHLRKIHDYGGLSKQVEELLRTAKENDEMMKRLAHPLLENVQELTSALRTSVADVDAFAQRYTSFNEIQMANRAIADIMDEGKYIETNIGRILDMEKSAAASAFTALSIPDLARLTQYSAIGEISLEAQKMMAHVNLGAISSAYDISSKHMAALESSFLGFAESYSALYRSIEASKVDIVSLDWFVTELPPVEIYTGAGLARVLSVPAPTGVEPAFPFEQGIVEDIEVSLEEMLVELDPDLVRAWQGAKQSLKGNNPDRNRHVTVSLRELLTHVLHKTAPDEELIKWTSDLKHFHKGRPTRAARLLFICRGVNKDPFTDFVKRDVASHVSFLDIFQEGTHGMKVPFTELQMETLMIRTESLLRFILTVSKGSNA